MAKGKRPKPYRVEAFANPEEQAKKIVALLAAEIFKRIAQIKGNSEKENEKSTYGALMESILAMQKQLMDEVSEHASKMEKGITEIIAKVFPDHAVKFEPLHDEDKFAALFKAGVQLRMGPTGGHMSDLERQGSGARRTLLWAALKLMAENDMKGEGGCAKPFILLLDEPELCLHPAAIRDARDVLYRLAEGDNWQVMITTHSPIFIDLARDNTTIIRVELDNGTIMGTTLFRSSFPQFTLEDRMQLKLLNSADPYFAEFFFGGTTIIVEGDTEHTAFHYLLQDDAPDDQRNHIQIVRARGKDRIVALCKILNRFEKEYAVLHDCDSPDSPAWEANGRIHAEVAKARPGVPVRLIALLANFEQFCWNITCEKVGSGKDKPYAALEKLKVDAASLGRVRQLLEALRGKGDVPSRALEWSRLTKGDLYTALNKVNPGTPEPVVPPQLDILFPAPASMPAS